MKSFIPCWNSVSRIAHVGYTSDCRKLAERCFKPLFHYARKLRPTRGCIFETNKFFPAVVLVWKIALSRGNRVGSCVFFFSKLIYSQEHPHLLWEQQCHLSCANIMHMVPKRKFADPPGKQYLCSEHLSLTEFNFFWLCSTVDSKNFSAKTI